MSIADLLSLKCIPVWKCVFYYLCSWDMWALRVTCKKLKRMVDNAVERDPSIKDKVIVNTLSVTGHLIHLAFFGQSVEWEKSLDHRDLPVDAPLFVDAQLSMFETLDIQFDDSDNDSDRDLPEIESYRNEVSAEQWSGWDLMLSNGWHKKQSACQALCKAYALNRGRMVVAALRNMEEKWIASTGRRLFRAGVLLLEEFHGMLAEGLLPVFIQFMKTAMYHLLYSVWECAGRMGGSTSEERTNDDDIDPKLSFSELIEVILREVYRQKSPKGSESSAKVIDERMQMLKAELIDTPLFHSAHFDNSPLCRCTTARRCQVCAYVQSLKMALEKRLHGDQIRSKLAMRKSELERLAWTRRRRLTTAFAQEAEQQRRILSEKLATLTDLKIKPREVFSPPPRPNGKSIAGKSPAVDVKLVKQRHSVDTAARVSSEEPAGASLPGKKSLNNEVGAGEETADKEMRLLV